MEQLLTEIRAYCAAKGITPVTFGRYAVNDGKFVGRIETAGQCLPRTSDRAREYMRSNPPQTVTHTDTHTDSQDHTVLGETYD